MNLSQTFNKLPSEIMGIYNDEYTAFCFNEACGYMINRLKDGDKMVTPKLDKHGNKTTFNQMVKEKGEV